MKAPRIGKYGVLNSLEIANIEKPIPSDKEVLIKVSAVSFNDWG